MKKIIFMLFISLFIFSCSQEGQKNIEIKQKSINNKKPINIESYEKIILPLDSKVKNSTEFKSCMQQASLNCAEQASYQIAAKNWDTWICNKIQNSEFKQSCIDNANYLIALDKQDLNLCKNIKNKIVQRNCTDELAYKIALKNKDIKYCETKESEEVIQDCKNEFYLNIALKEKNKEYCEKINDEYKKEWCYGELSIDNKTKKEDTIIEMNDTENKKKLLNTKTNTSLTTK